MNMLFVIIQNILVLIGAEQQPRDRLIHGYLGVDVSITIL